MNKGGINTVTSPRQKTPHSRGEPAWDLSRYPLSGRVSASRFAAPWKLIASTVRDQGAIYSHHERIRADHPQVRQQRDLVRKSATGARFAAGRPGAQPAWDRNRAQPCSYSTRRVNWGVAVVFIRPSRPNRNVGTERSVRATGQGRYTKLYHSDGRHAFRDHGKCQSSD
jgi:hypothetical protein